jgi:deoxycytidylate deaminase
VVRENLLWVIIVPYPAVENNLINVLKESQNGLNKKDVNKLSSFCDDNFKLSIHAEENCLQKYFHDSKFINYNSRSKLRILVIRIDNHGNLINSKPCNNCIEMMRKYGIKKISYSNENGIIITESIKNITGSYSSAYRSINILLNK